MHSKFYMKFLNYFFNFYISFLFITIMKNLDNKIKRKLYIPNILCCIIPFVVLSLFLCCIIYS